MKQCRAPQQNFAITRLKHSRRYAACSIVFAISLFVVVLDRAESGSGYLYFQALTGDDADSDKSRWDSLYRKTKGYVYGKEPASFLVENLELLPIGRALDVAMGEGRNAAYLAKKGFDVTGVDISEVAIRKAHRLARENGIHIRAVTADLNKYQIPADSYQVIMVFYYLQRSLVPQIIRGLKSGGVVIFENYTVEQLKYDKQATRPFLLQKGELKGLFKELQILKYQETDNGKAAVASLVARKR